MLSQMWGSHFPVHVDRIALEYTQRFPDPVLKVVEADLPTFEGALYPLKKKCGWAILYNPTISSTGRINYTQAHELGHYFAHRARVPVGFECGQRDVLGEAARTALRQQEREADEFASYLLMPLDDFRAQVATVPMGIDLLRHCADRYGVSFTAAALKWIESTDLCAALVVATNGYVSWCRRSKAAVRARVFYPSGMELPVSSIAALGGYAQSDRGTIVPAGVWRSAATREIAIFADRYEMTISLLIFEHDRMAGDGWQDEQIVDTVDHFEASVTEYRRLD
jgi:hypothetical protein